MSWDGYAFDIYPYNDPNGTRLVRLTPAKAVQLAFRLPEQGFGMADGQIIIHSAHADATAANFHKHNLVKVVAIQGETETKVGGFFLEEGDFAALSTKEAGGRLLSFRGPNTVYYLERAILREDPFSEVPAAGDVRGSHTIDGMWAWRDADLLGINVGPGPIMVRGLEEGFYEPGPSGTSADAPLADATWDFSRTVDSDGNAWQPQSNEWELRWGTTILDLLLLMLKAGLHWRSGPDLDYHAFATDPAVDRTSTTFAADKVRFAAGENIVTEVNRDITASVERSAVLVLGTENTTEYVTGGSSDVTWIGRLDASVTSDSLALQTMGQTNLDDREVQVEAAFPLKHIVSDDELNGGYIPFIHYVPGDLVTLHTGTGDHDFNDFAIPVAAVRILHDAAGNWFGMPELGAQSISAESKAFEERVNRIIHQPGGHSHPREIDRPSTWIPLTPFDEHDLPHGYNLSKRGIVIERGGSGSWKEARVESPNVFWDPKAGHYKMVFVGYSGTPGSEVNAALGYAYSTDLETWTEFASNPFFEKSGAGDDAEGCSGPFVWYEDGTYHLYYIGLTATGHEQGTKSICHATSTDFVTWTRNGAIIETAGTGWRQDAVWHPNVVKRASRYYLFFNASSGATEEIGYASAASPSGPWAVDDQASPVLQVGASGQWDDVRIGDPYVYRIGETWYMAYYGNDGTNSQDGLAYTSDADFPLGWTKYSGNPVLTVGAAGSFDDKDAARPAIWITATRYYHWYSTDDGSFEIGIAVAIEDIGSVAGATASALGRPIMAQDPSDSHWYVVVAGDGTALMAEG